MSNNQYIVSARKYRPITFSSVVGQRNLIQTLKNAIASGRIAQAYLFCGPRGVGKTSCARIFARTINCLNPTEEGEACGTCDSCIAISQGNSFNLIELDAASNNSVDDIRNLIEQVNIPPQQGKYKVFIIDEVHMLSSQAFNAFLKTLEEPPKYAIFILATTEKHKVIPTILSRCQIYDFKRITVDDMVEHLKYVASDRGVKADSRALAVIARKADGALRDALSIFDQVSASSHGNITYDSTLENLNVLDSDFYFQLVDSFAKSDISAALLIYKTIRDKGFDSLFFINGLASHIRDLMVAADSRTLPLLETDGESAELFKTQTARLPLQWYYSAMKILNNADYTYRTSSNKQLLVEVTLIRLCQLLKPSTPPFDQAEDLPSLRDITSKGSEPPIAAPTISSVPNISKTNIENIIPKKPTPSTDVPHSRPKSFRLNAMEGEQTIQATNNTSNTSSDFTDEQLNEAWTIFMAHNPGMHVLLSEMRKAKIKRSSPTTIGLTIENPSSVKYFDGPGSKLLPFLREQLHNDSLVFEISISNNQERIHKLPPKEFVQKIIDNNPRLGNFLKSIEPEVSM